ncbi:hypothetical protein AVEN_154791-1 [Araneus ventricosus]|uniref:Uncharacterized protein n=1 Tax=Araneus ventricosus TaxID=182803 RepID=A0A4Y2BWA0_ARAVE|nr:hypothetical protein AVEN_154791-1 [Araneus ventricosus]
MNWQKITVYNDDTYTCDVKRQSATKSSNQDAVMWANDVFNSALNSPVYKSLCQDYKYVKVDKFTFVQYVDVVTYDVVNATTTLVKPHIPNLSAYHVNDLKWEKKATRSLPSAGR